MDPISHALFAKTLHSLASTRRLGPGAAAAFVLGGLSPDIDLLIAPLGWDIYLVHHEKGTHSLLGATFVAALLALLLRVLFRHASYQALFLMSWVGALTHIFLDFVGGSDMRIFAPLSDQRGGWHLIAMWEPLVVLALVVLHLPGVVRRRRPWAIVFLVSFGCFLAVKYVSQRMARQTYYAHSNVGEDAQLVRVEEIRGSLSSWRFYDDAAEGLRVFQVEALRGRIRLLFETRPSADDSLVRASRLHPVIRNLFRLGELPFARVEAQGNARLVRWSDMQFCDRDRCDVSFGVAFDDSSKALWQFVDIGCFRQKRPTSARPIPEVGRQGVSESTTSTGGRD